MAFKRLVRFVENGQAVYGDLVSSEGESHTVRKLSGSPFDTLQQTDVVVQTNKVSQCPLECQLRTRSTNKYHS
jgi:hypothetical protein